MLNANFNGTTVILPGVYSSITVAPSASGIANTGRIVLIGESSQGPDFSKETDLSTAVAYGPGDFALVASKYGSGQVTDAFKQAVQSSSDPAIAGSPSLIYVLKTNPSVKASSQLVAMGSSANYALLQDFNWGVPGNQISYTITSATVDGGIATGSFTWVPNVASLTTQFVVDGALNPASPITVSSNTLPSALASALTSATAVTVTGGASRSVLTGTTGTLAVGSISGNTATFTRSVAWDNTPSVGDTWMVPAGSTYAGAGNANVGAYVITAAGATTVTATKLSDAAKPGGVVGVITAPAIVAATNILASTDVAGYAPVVVTLSTPAAGTAVQGIGKTMEWAELTGASDRLSNCCYALSATKSAFVSTSAVPFAMTAASEVAVSLNVNQPVTSTQQTFTVGGEAALLISYKNASATAATVTVSATTLITTVTGVSSVNLNVTLSNYSTLGQLATFINSQTGYSCQTATATLGFLPPTALDQGTFGILTLEGALTGRVKDDAYRFTQAVSGSGVVMLGVNPTVGLPALQTTPLLLSGGARGATTDAIIQSALTAAESLTCNFVVPLFSEDATADAVLGVTDPSSTYTISAINANTKTHVLAMSTLKRKRNRQGCLSILSTFSGAKSAASNISTARCTMCFQYVKTANSAGSLVQQQPWMAAVTAAGMQAAGAYRAIFNKNANVSAVISTGSDFSDQNDTNLEGALQAGLMPMHRLQIGGFAFVSDQTTYGVDNNPIYNSLSAMYNTDVVALTLAQQLQADFIGASLADVNAGIILSQTDGIMAELLRNKWIAPSSKYPLGWGAGSVTISGPTFVVSLAVVSSTSLYYGLINALVTINQQ